MINDTIRIRLSLGLIVVAIVHAILLGVVLTALHQRPAQAKPETSWTAPVYRPASPSAGAIEKLQEPQSVNLQAQGEIKQQILDCTPNCPPTRIYPSPVVVQPTVVHPVVTPAPAIEPTIVTPTSVTASPPPKKNYQIALFVSGDATSQKLQQWFDQDKQLSDLREHCEYQTYTSSNPVYKTRFAEIVPVDQFPVVLFQDATGGHIHAAGRSMIPSTPGELYSDLRQGYELYKQAKEAQKTGALKTRGYSWDDAITPTLYLSAEDCPDGFCPAEPTDSWRPGDRVRDLFNDAPRPRNALMWLSAGEIATVALIVVAMILLGFILIKRGM